ncbi:MAG TPA: hypothetical protein VKU01_18575 [Bryobacteraceae bacterium]|nr:hypothetical protein [Bryobacteraceae bacterium]
MFDTADLDLAWEQTDQRDSLPRTFFVSEALVGGGRKKSALYVGGGAPGRNVGGNDGGLLRARVLGKQSSLGPIDPQLRGIPAQGVINEFKRALEEYKADHDSLMIWQSILQQYRPTFPGQCKQAIDWTNAFVTDQFSAVMFEGDPES